MALEQITFNIGAFNDSDASGNNYFVNKVFEVKNQSDNTFATIYTDASGATQIPQNGIDNISNSRGECNFYIDDGDFYLEVDSQQKNFNVGKFKTDFANIDEVKAYPKLSKLIGQRITTGEYHAGTGYGGAGYDVVSSSSVTPNGIDIIQGFADSGAAIKLRLGDYVSAAMFGCLTGEDNSQRINAMVDSGASIDIDKDYEFSDIYIYPYTNFYGEGVLTGFNAEGSKPLKAQLDATDEAGRLSLLETYKPNNVVLKVGVSSQFTGKKFTNCLFRPEGVGGAVIAYGNSDLRNCAFHGVSINSGTGSSILADNAVITDANGYGVYAFHGGSIDAPNSLVYKCERALYVFQGGTINASDSEFYSSTGIQVFANGGGTIRMPRSKVYDGAFGGVKCDYTSTIQMADSEVVNNGGVGVASESCSSVFAQGSLISGNGAWALTTSHNGYLQARGATISNNGNLVASDIAAITTLTGGFITLTEAIITDDNAVDSNGRMIVAKANGYIMSEPAGGVGKEDLTANHYSPLFGIMGNGSAIIYDTETVFNQYPDDGVGFSSSQKATNTRKAGVVSGSTLTISSSWVIVNDDSAVTIDNIVLQSGFYTDEITIQPSGGGGGVTIQQGSGNIRLGAAKVLAGANKITKLYKTEFSNLWLGLE